MIELGVALITIAFIVGLTAGYLIRMVQDWGLQ